MKKLILFIALMGICTYAFASAKKPDPSTFNGCIQRPYTECAQYGNPWTGPMTVTWSACANDIYDACRCAYKPELIKYNNKPCV